MTTSEELRKINQGYVDGLFLLSLNPGLNNNSGFSYEIENWNNIRKSIKEMIK